MRRTEPHLPCPPLFASHVAAGFPSPADDYIDKPLCLNELLAPRPAATLFVHMPDDSLTGCRIWPGDILIVDRSLKPTHGRLVAVQLHGEVIIRRLMTRGRQGWLKPENPAYATIELKEGLDYRILGVVRHQIHTV